MGLFRPYKQGQTETEPVKSSEGTEAPAVSDTGPDQALGAPQDDQDAQEPRGRRPKAGPTPTRAQAEAARMERLHPNLSRKEVRRRNRRAKEERRMSGLEAMEKRPERTLLRNYVDSRRTFGEYMMPIFFVIMALWFIIILVVPKQGAGQVWIVNLLTLVMLVTLLGWGLDALRLWRGAKKELAVHCPGVPRKGLLSYLNNRLMTPRRWRNPAPVVERGGAPRVQKAEKSDTAAKK